MVKRADVYISYAREDFALADSLSKILVERGIRVWSDRYLKPGEDWRAVIQTQFEDSALVVALFSFESVRSHFVLEEASLALHESKLLPVQIDNVSMPLGFRQVQAGLLRSRDQASLDELARLIVERIAAGETGRIDVAQESSGRDRMGSREFIRRARPLLAALSLAVGALATFSALESSIGGLSEIVVESPAWLAEHWKWILAITGGLVSVVAGAAVLRQLKQRRSSLSQAVALEQKELRSAGEHSRVDALAGLTTSFFLASGRGVEELAAHELRVPEPVIVSRQAAPVPEEVEQLRRALRPTECGYLAHREKLPASVEELITRLRIRGLAVGILSDRLMQAAIEDGRTRQALAEIEREARGGDNLFQTRNALLLPRYFFGRESLLAELGQQLARGEHVLVLGTRKCGKTSCLNMLRQSLVEYPIATVDLQRYDRNREEWHQALFSELVFAYDRWGAAKFGRWPFPKVAPETASELQQALRDRHEWVRQTGDGKALIVILDEIERVVPRASETDAARRFVLALGALRNLGQGNDRLLSVIGADLRPESNRTNLLPNGETNPFFGLLHETPLPPLTWDEAREMVTFIAHKMGVESVEPGFVDELVRLSGGHAYLCRLLAAAAYEARECADSLAARDLSAGHDALDEDAEVSSFIEQNFWAPLNQAERAYLAAVARSRRPPADEVARGSLKQQGLCINDRIPIELLRDWIVNRVPESAPVPRAV